MADPVHYLHADVNGDCPDSRMPKLGSSDPFQVTCERCLASIRQRKLANLDAKASKPAQG